MVSMGIDFDWLRRMGAFSRMIFFVLTFFWPNFSQQSLISSKDKSRDDLQQNLQISVNAISVLLSNENYTSNELNALLIGEGGLIQETVRNGTTQIIVKCNLETPSWKRDGSGWYLTVSQVCTTVFISSREPWQVFEWNISPWDENKSP